MKKSLRSKRRLLRNYPKTVYRRAIRAEYNLTIMVFLTSCFSVVGHGLAFIIYLPFTPFIERENCTVAFVSLAYYMPFSINFFFYLLFNKNFKRALLAVLVSCLKQLKMDHLVAKKLAKNADGEPTHRKDVVSVDSERNQRLNI